MDTKLQKLRDKYDRIMQQLDTLSADDSRRSSLIREAQGVEAQVKDACALAS